MQDIIRCAYSAEVRARAAGQGDAERVVDVIASTDALDSYGDVVVQDWNLERYFKNPVVLWGHNSYGMPIGFAENVAVQDGKLKAAIRFVDAKANPLAEQVWEGMKQGSLRAVSVGFRPGRVDRGQRDGKDVYFLSANELIEISVVPIPANPDAVAERAKSLDALVARDITGPARAPTTETESTMSLKAIIAALALAETATEADVLTSIKSLQDTNKSLRETNASLLEPRDALLQVTGKTTAPEALGVVRAWKQGSEGQTTLAAKVDELSRSIEERDRADIIKTLRASGKLAPALLPWAQETSLAALKAFAEKAPTIPQFAAEHTEPTTPAAGPMTTPEGKTWEQLAPAQKADIYQSNRPLYDAMKADASRRGVL